MSNKSTIIRDVTLNYAKVYKPQENRFGKVVFDIQLEFGKDRIEEMSEFGKVRQLDNGNFCINLDRPERNSKGQKNKIRVVDSEKNNITDGIGNGSKGNVIAYSYDWQKGGTSGRKTVLIAVQVLDLVPYSEENAIDFDIVIGEGDNATPAQDF